MEFIKSEGTAELEAALILAINTVLMADKKVLWLVPGGSNINVACQVMKQLKANLGNLMIMLSDERIGKAGHPDSNYSQLHDKGFDYREATFNDILTAGDQEAITRLYAEEAKRNFNAADKIIGFFGMGSDGHIAGILPHSPAATAGHVWAESYESEPYTRVTLTPFALSHVQQAFVGAYGSEKLPALTNLHDKMLSITEQPAQILHHITESKIYNDQIGGVV